MQKLHYTVAIHILFHAWQIPQIMLGSRMQFTVNNSAKEKRKGETSGVSYLFNSWISTPSSVTIPFALVNIFYIQ